eukprot:3978630-Prymnesium_polylepis.1
MGDGGGGDAGLGGLGDGGGGDAGLGECGEWWWCCCWWLLSSVRPALREEVAAPGAPGAAVNAATLIQVTTATARARCVPAGQRHRGAWTAGRRSTRSGT